MADILRSALPEFEILFMNSFPDAPDVDETGETFEENARLKAISAAKHSGVLSIADDGGLCIDALSGSPGVKSHRFLGAKTGFPEKMKRILTMMLGLHVDNRNARFQCAIAIASPNGEVIGEALGSCEGRIAESVYGSHGFGYDPIFYLPELNCHMAELTPAEKHKVSHRGKALAKAVQILKQFA